MLRLPAALPLLLSCLLCLPAVAKEVESIAWPPGVEAKINEALAIRHKALRQYPNLRPPDERAAREFNRCLDEAAAGLADHGLEAPLRKAEGVNLKAKLGCWALDRRERPETYQRITASYTGFSRRSDQVSPGGRNPAGANLPGSRPPAVRPEDRTAGMRLVLEYAYFAPPPTIAFSLDYWRSNLADGLRRIGDGRSLLLLREDLLEQARLHPGGDGPRQEYGTGQGLEALCAFGNREGFHAVAELWTSPLMRVWIQRWISATPETRVEGPFSRDPVRKQADIAIWKALAMLDWQQDAEKDLAAWLRALPAPKPLSPETIEKSKRMAAANDGDAVLGCVPAPQPKPAIAMAEALGIADREFGKSGRLESTRPGWVWLLGADGDPAARQWLVARFDEVDGKFRNGSVVSIGMDGKVSLPENPANPFGLGPLEEPAAPRPGLMEALRRANDFATPRIKLEDYYLAVVSPCQIDGSPEVKWLVRWAVDRTKYQGGRDRFQVVVATDGSVTIQDETPRLLSLGSSKRQPRPQIRPHP